MKLSRTAGSTSNILQIKILDSTKTDGSGLTGLTSSSGSLTAYYVRESNGTATSISLTTMTAGTFASGGFLEISAANMPGWYQFCPPDAALAASAKSVGIQLKGAASMAQCDIEIDLASTVIVTTNNDKTGYTASTVSDKTGYSLSSTGLNSVVTVEPSGPPAWGNTVIQAVSWIMCLARNKITQTSSTQTVISDAAANISTAAVQDDGTTFQRAKWS